MRHSRPVALLVALLSAVSLLLDAQPAWAVSYYVTSVNTPLVSHDRVRLSWTNPTFASFVGVLVRRSTGTTPPATVTSGTYVGYVAAPGHVLDALSLAPGTTYSFSLWPRSSKGTYGYRTTMSVRTAPAPVGGVTATVTDTRVTLGWTNPSTATFTGTMIRRALGTVPPTGPGVGTLVANVGKPSHSFIDLAVKAGTTYSYALFAHDAVPRYAPRVVKTVTTWRDLTPPGPVQAVAVSAAATSAELSWTNPTASDLAGVMIRRAAGPVAPSATSGVLVSQVAAPGRTLTDAGLSPGTQYSWSLFARDRAGNLAAPAKATAQTTVPPDVSPPAAVADLRATGTQAPPAVALSWTNPDDADVSGVVVRRSLGATAPTTPDDGVLIATVSAPQTSLTDSDVVYGGAYAYAAFAFDKAGNYSTGRSVTVTVPPSPTPVHVGGTLSGDQTWAPGAAPVYVLDCDVLVPAHTTLTVLPGTIIKAAAGVRISVTGSLVATANADAPAFFTSLRDDSVGGDTNGDGAASSPAPGDWGQITATSYDATAPATVSFDHAVVTYGSGLASTRSRPQAWDYEEKSFSAISVRDSALSAVMGTAIHLEGLSSVRLVGNAITTVTGDGIWVDAGAVPPTVSSNTVSGASGRALQVMGIDLQPSLLVDNQGHDNGISVLAISGNLTEDVTLPQAGLPWVIGNRASLGYYGLNIPVGTTMRLNAGAVLKFDTSEGEYGNQHGLAVLGTLIATGTEEAPVVLTSIRDDSVGGDTNGDGAATTPLAGDWWRVISGSPDHSQPARVSLDHTVVRYGAGLLAACCGPIANQPGMPIEPVTYQPLFSGASVTHSELSHLSGTAIRGGYTGGLVARDNVIQDVTGDGIWARFAPRPDIRDNVVTGVSGRALQVESHELDPALLSGNSGSHNGLSALEVQGWLVGDLTLPRPGLPWAVGGAASGEDATGLDVLPGVHVTLNPGAVLKFDGAGLTVHGSLDAAGTAEQPVVLTSVKDDSAGGAWREGGTAIAPAPGDWDGISVAGSEPVQLDHVALRFADTALYSSSRGPVAVHGSITQSRRGVDAATYVDATQVDWGTPSGPAPIGTGPSATGAVNVVPWVGYVPPTVPAPGPAGTLPDASAGCKPLMFLGARGSGEQTSLGVADRGDDAAYADWLDGLGPNVSTLYDAFAGALRERGLTDADWRAVAVRYQARGVPGGGAPSATSFADAGYFASVWEGVDRIEQYLNDGYARCGSSQKYVLAGYSQGALAIHLYLAQRAPQYLRDLVTAVGLQGDPGKTGSGGEGVFTDGWQDARTTAPDVVAAEGVYTAGQIPRYGPLPDDVSGRSVTLCHRADVVCANRVGATQSAHSNYTTAELSALGRWLAERATGTSPS